jgi:hypothetical protein
MIGEVRDDGYDVTNLKLQTSNLEPQTTPTGHISWRENVWAGGVKGPSVKIFGRFDNGMVTQK